MHWGIPVCMHVSTDTKIVIKKRYYPESVFLINKPSCISCKAFCRWERRVWAEPRSSFSSSSSRCRTPSWQRASSCKIRSYLQKCTQNHQVILKVEFLMLHRTLHRTVTLSLCASRSSWRKSLRPLLRESGLSSDWGSGVSPLSGETAPEPRVLSGVLPRNSAWIRFTVNLI